MITEILNWTINEINKEVSQLQVELLSDQKKIIAFIVSCGISESFNPVRSSQLPPGSHAECCFTLTRLHIPGCQGVFPPSFFHRGCNHHSVPTVSHRFHFEASLSLQPNSIQARVFPWLMAAALMMAWQCLKKSWTLKKIRSGKSNCPMLLVNPMRHRVPGWVREKKRQSESRRHARTPTPLSGQYPVTHAYSLSPGHWQPWTAVSALLDLISMA